MKNSIPVFVFSFNRPDFLRNCLASIRHTMPNAEIHILDDCSWDDETKRVLAQEKERTAIYFSKADGPSEFKTGGLCGLMNLAMHIAREKRHPYVLFIQDDMQMVRALRDRDMDHIGEYFHNVPNAIQLSTTFIRKLGTDGFLNDYSITRPAFAYLRKREAERGKSNFSDTGVFSVDRFFELFDRFEVGEDKNSAKAMERGLTCGRSFFPFINWLPYPMSFRGRKRSMMHLVFEYFGRSGFYPIEFMTEREVAEFMTREPSILPIMEEFLTCPTSPRQDIWSTGGGEYNFVVYGSLPARFFVQAKKLRALLK